MKLNKKASIINAVTFVSALLVVGISFSAQVDKESISTRCEVVYNNLDRLFQEQQHAPCALDVRYVGWVMQGASGLVRSERYSTALHNLNVADRNLSKIYSKTQECAYFSPKVIPSLNEVKNLINELENTPN